MRKTTAVVGFVLVSLAADAQKKNDNISLDSILSEGRLLYRLEMASWHATDIILRKHKDVAAEIGGYFSYESNHTIHAVFFSKAAEPEVISSVLFDTAVNPATARVYNNKRNFSRHEQKLYTIRKEAHLQVNTDSQFVRFENTSFNFIPVADSSCGKVYVLTEPEVNGVVIFGNDYQLLFNNKDSLLAKRPLHRNMVPVEFGKDTDPELIDTYHMHSTHCGKYITPTDICTLMLFNRFSKWKQHLVMSRSHVCAWNMETNEIEVLTTDEWNKLNNNKKPVSVN